MPRVNELSNNIHKLLQPKQLGCRFFLQKFVGLFAKMLLFLGVIDCNLSAVVL